MTIIYLVQDELKSIDGSVETKITNREFSGRGSKAAAVKFADSLCSQEGSVYNTDRAVRVYRAEFYHGEVRRQTEIHSTGYTTKR